MASLGSGMIYSGTNVSVAGTIGGVTYTVPAGFIFVGQVYAASAGNLSIAGHSAMAVATSQIITDLIVGPGVGIGLSGTSAIFLIGILIQNP